MQIAAHSNISIENSIVRTVRICGRFFFVLQSVGSALWIVFDQASFFSFGSNFLIKILPTIGILLCSAIDIFSMISILPPSILSFQAIREGRWEVRDGAGKGGELSYELSELAAAHNRSSTPPRAALACASLFQHEGALHGKERMERRDPFQRKWTWLASGGRKIHASAKAADHGRPGFFPQDVQNLPRTTTVARGVRLDIRSKISSGQPNAPIRMHAC